MPDRSGASDDPDATRAIPAQSEGHPPDGAGSQEDDAEATRAMPEPAPRGQQPPSPQQAPTQQSRTPPPAEPDRWRPGQRGQRPDQHHALPPPNLPPPPQPRKKGGRGRTIRRVVLAVLLVWILFLIAVPIWAWSQIDKVDAEPDGDRPADQPGTTFLVVGSDSREGLSEDEQQNLATGDVPGERADTIMVLHTGAGPTTLVSLPRDSPVEIPGEGSDKINAAFAFGGADLLVETVEQNTGIRIDGYVEIGLGGFVNVVDALGGVEVCPEEAISDAKAGLDIQAGCQELDGPDALGYARTRVFEIADLQRVQNQREVVSAIADDAASPWTVLNPWRYFRLSSAGSESIRIGDDVGPIDLARFAWAMGEVGGGRTCTVPLENADATWDPERSAQLFRLIIEDRTDELTTDLCQASGLSG